jgi:Fic family protein
MKPRNPPKLPVKIDSNLFTKELGEASVELGRLDGQQKTLQNPSLLIAPLTTKEATTSSRIEGTRTTVSEVFLYESGEKTKNPETVEVFNYRRAMLWAMEALKSRDFNLSFIRELHSMLLEKTRGHKKRGKFREEVVFIGGKGATIEQATYIPPEAIFIPEYMENLEQYILANTEDSLMKVAIIHYQFEAIHPFSDGNGRIGRLLIPLYLYQKGLLIQPILYLSGYLNKYKDNYINSLHIVDETQRYGEWIKFFLVSVKEQAKETQDLIQAIRDLEDQAHHKVEIIKSFYKANVINFIFRRPIFKSKELTNELNCHRSTTLRLIKKFVDLEILKALPLGRKKNAFIFPDLIKLL